MTVSHTVWQAYSHFVSQCVSVTGRQTVYGHSLYAVSFTVLYTVYWHGFITVS